MNRESMHRLLDEIIDANDTCCGMWVSAHVTQSMNGGCLLDVMVHQRIGEAVETESVMFIDGDRELAKAIAMVKRWKEERSNDIVRNVTDSAAAV